MNFTGRASTCTQPMSLPENARWGATQPPSAISIKENDASGSQASTAQISIASKRSKRVVLDSGAIILGGRIERLGDEFWTVEEVISEIKDENARLSLSTLPFDINIREVDPESLTFVTRFSKLTGDFVRLSKTDLKIRPPGKEASRTSPALIENEATKQQSEVDDLSEQLGDGLTFSTGKTEVPEHRKSDAELDDSDEDVDIGEFERRPLHDFDDEGWICHKSDNRSVSHSDEAASVCSSSTSSKALPPGWFNGDDDDLETGWITPDNHDQFIPQGCQRREDSDQAVACATTDYAMQNVLLQVGLRVLNMDGLVVREVKQFALKCHACFRLCRDNTKNFCPACGNATLMRVSMWVLADGRVTYSKGIKNFNLRGTRYSLPLPKQGRGKDDLVLREDQLVMSKHRQRRTSAAKGDEAGGQGLAIRSRGGRNDLADQDVIGMGYSGGGRRNPNASRRSRR